MKDVMSQRPKVPPGTVPLMIHMDDWLRPDKIHVDGRLHGAHVCCADDWDGPNVCQHIGFRVLDPANFKY